MIHAEEIASITNNTHDGAAAERKRLEWRCRRGTRELDYLMEGFLARGYDQASETDKKAFQQLVLMSDPDLYDLLIGRGHHADASLNRIADAVRAAATRA